MRILAWIMAALFPLPSLAADFVAARDLPAGTVIISADLRPAENTQKADDPSPFIGLETRVTVYEGRPVLKKLLRVPTLIERNQIVRLQFRRGEVYIATDGRALEDGSAGDLIRVLNQASRNTITARIQPDGTLHVAR
ncbi:flagella basal body P-ring formation protein FlgA [Paracoccus onubensis]|uniref:Flagella basal body P-ring formation protein FlgA n=2 Tax=Paracoccus onubensis TaxID=1675788 RepID=A0A418SVE0_9RHOB|nr:flagella basal body P-ring formation protein FlgA [Paracoccus onubensis]